MKTEEVSPSLKRRFSDWIDSRTAQGIKTYGTPLKTFNGRSGDAIQEILDFSQYQEQDLMEAEALLRAIVSEECIEPLTLAEAVDFWIQKREQ